MPETKTPAALELPTSLPVLGTERSVDVALTRVVAQERPEKLGACTHTRQAIKQGDVFVVSHTDGELHPGCDCGQGVYYHDTRFVSGLTMALDGRAPVVLAFTAEHNFFSRTEGTNEQWERPDAPVKRETIHLERTRLVDGGVQERVVVRNFNPMAVTTTLEVELRADFKDIFEVRGFFGKQKPGVFLHPRVGEQDVELLYVGADGITRHLKAGFDKRPASVTTVTWPNTHETGLRLRWDVELPARGGEWTLDLGLTPCIDGVGAGGAPDQPPPPVGLARLEALSAARQAGLTRVSSSHHGFAQFINRGVEDILTLATPTPDGLFPTAGIPWYCCPFGRDSLITAIQSLPLGPTLAVSTLRYLARHQGAKVDPFHEETPGKILHELRRGELANLGEIPFSTYYGTIDATPLWLVLLAETYRWSGDRRLLTELWPHALRALAWLDEYGDVDGDGFVEYAASDEKGLSNQGWKDSFDSIIHPDGKLADAPIALAEVQGYVYAAKRQMAMLAGVMGDQALAAKLEGQAAELKARFNEAFWVADGGFYAVAIAGKDKRRVETRTSNPGHALWCGLIADDRQASLVEGLLAPDMFNGWGVRTMSSASPNYNPISYHNGTVWPHDVSLIAKGMADMGFKAGAGQLLTGLFDASGHFEHRRLPELFCGFERQGAFARPVPYPVACSPQAWAAGTPLMLLSGVLGLQPDAANGTLHVVKPALPDWLPDVRLAGLQVGGELVDLRFYRVDGHTAVEVMARGNLKVEIEV